MGHPAPGTRLGTTETRRNYIHQNPVRANLAPTAELYPYSSAYQPKLSSENLA